MVDNICESQWVPFSIINPRKMMPISCILFMAMLWIVISAIAPVKMYTSPQIYPYLLLGLSFVGLLLGLVLFEPRTISSVVVDPKEQKKLLRNLYNLTYCLGLSGILFRIIDWVVYRGFAVGLDFAENLQKATEGGGNPFSSMAVFLVPFTVAPYMFYVVAKRNGWHVGRTWTAAGLAILWPILTLMLGSRSSMFMQIGMLVIARVLVLPRFPKVAFWIILLIFVTLIYIAGFIFIERMNQIGVDIDKIARLSIFTNLVPATNDYYHLSKSVPDYLKNIIFINNVMMQYFLHGVPEFIFLVENYNHGEVWGGYTFVSITRIFASVLDDNFEASALIDLSPRLGVYTTFFGPFYIDFGVFIPVVGVIIGGFVSWIRRQVLNGNVVVLPLYTALTMQMLAAVVVCTVNGAYGIFYDIAFSGLWIGTLAFTRIRVPRRIRKWSST